MSTVSQDADHAFFMQQCISIAREAQQRGESPVGSVIVRNKQIIATGMESSKMHQDITFHAEIEAIRQAITVRKSQDLSDCILYTTHEPCIMCSYLIRHTKINTIIIGLTTGELGGYSSNHPILKDAGIDKWGTPPHIITGILEKECSALHAS